MKFPHHRYVSEVKSKEEVYTSFVDPVRRWIEGNVASLNKLQLMTIPLITAEKSTLILAPTGSGKTLAAFLGIINTLYSLALKKELENKIYAIYVSPLKALNNDIHKNLQLPLEGIAEFLPEGISKVRSLVRTGDTTSYEKSKMLRTPPHILITTPESLGIALASKSFSKLLQECKWLLIDEIHALAENKRGVFLSLVVEWLEYNCKIPPTRIGLSATISPVEKIANYLMGRHWDERVIHIVDYGTVKELDLEILVPETEMRPIFQPHVVEKHVEQIFNLIDDHNTSIVFANTRHWSERVAKNLITKAPNPLKKKIAVHHSSLDREVRFDIEKQMKGGELRVVVTSASLELGIDIGSIDLAIQLNSPKTVNRALQRIGRAGHFFHSISKGRFLVASLDDLLEVTALSKLCLNGILDDVHLPTKSLDVLAQIIIGLTIEQNWELDEIFEIVTRSYNFHTVTQEELFNLIDAMSSPLSPEENWKYGRIWFDRDKGIVGRKGYQRQNFMMNIGTIPDTTTIDVVLEGTRNKIGTLAENFVEHLSEGSIFMLGGRTYLFLRTVGSKIVVREVFDKIPTIPSWRGEAMSRSLNVSYEVGRILRKFETELSSHHSTPDGKKDYLVNWLTSEYPLKKREAKILFHYLETQYSLNGLPSEETILLEKYVDVTGRVIIVALSIFGLEVNLPLGYAYSKALSEFLKTSIGVTANDNGFSLILPQGIDFDKQQLFSLIYGFEEFNSYLVRALEETELFKTRFRHVAVRALMVLKRSPKRKMTIDQVQRTAQKLIKELPEDFPLINEARREILDDLYRVDIAQEVIAAINSGIIKVKEVPDESPISPLAYSIILSAVSDVVLSEDRGTFLLDLHKKMIEKLRKREEESILFDPNEIANFYNNKYWNSEKFSDIERLQTFIVGTGGETKNFEERCFCRTKIEKEKIRELLSKLENIYLYKDKFWTLPTLLPELLFNPEEDQKIQSATGKDIGRKREELINSMLKEIPPPTIIEKAIKEYLHAMGPLTINELVDILSVKGEIIEESLFSLQRKGEVLGGEFTKLERQYIASDDRTTLASLHLTSREFSLHQLNILRLKRQHLFPGTEIDEKVSLKEVLEIHGPVRHVAELWARYTGFSWTKIRIALDQGEIYYGRFMAGRLCFIPSNLLSLFTSAYRTGSELTDIATDILNYIKSNVVASYSGIRNYFTVPQNELREALYQLESELYIGRLGWDLSMKSASRNILYTPLPNVHLQNLQEIAPTLIRKIIEWYGPLMIQDIIRLTKFDYSLIEESIQILESKGELTSNTVLSNDILYYGREEDFSQMKSIPIDSRVSQEISILPIYDPLIYSSIGSLSYLQTSTGEQYHIIFSGLTVGMIDVVDKTDYVQITNIDVRRELVDDFRFIELLANSLFSLAQNVYLTRNVVIEEIRSIPPNFPENTIFTLVMTRNGFFLDTDRLVGGLSHLTSLNLTDVIAVKLRNIVDRKKNEKDLTKIIEDLGKFTVEQLQAIVDTSLDSIINYLSSQIRQGNLHYRGRYIYTDLFWNQLEEDWDNLSDLERRVLEEIRKKNTTVSNLVQSLKQTDTTIQEVLTKLEKRNLIDRVNPFESNKKWRKSNRQRKKKVIDLSETIYSLIRLYGPISFDELRNHHEELSSYSRGMLLLHVTQLLQTNKISSVWLGEQHKKVFYFIPELREYIENPSRTSKLPEWMIVDSSQLPLKELLGISNLYFQGITHAIFHGGRVVATLQINIQSTDFEIEKIKLDFELKDEEILEVIKEIEGTATQHRTEQIKFIEIFGHAPIYWRD